MTAQLSLGPVLFNWKPEFWRDFYYRIADESPIARVYIGEVVCSKRTPFFEQLYPDVAERLMRAGKEIVFSTLAEVMIKRERKLTKSMCALTDYLVEANDASALYHLRGKPHAIGPYINVYNEETLAVLTERGAVHVTLPFELPAQSIMRMASEASQHGITSEIMVYGRIPLALSARCYHARAHGRVKDNCQFVCEDDPDGMSLKTLDGKDFLVVNGVQTLSYGYLNLIQELPLLQSLGISYLRLSPQTQDMVAISCIFQDVLDGKKSPQEAQENLATLNIPVPFSNGFFHKKPGYVWVTDELNRVPDTS